MSKEPFINYRQETDYIDFNEIRELVRGSQKIGLIKEFRRITGYGLKDSKDAVERIWAMDSDAMVDLFRQHTGLNTDPYTKEEFLHLVEEAIDGMEALHFDDMLEAVAATLNNIRQKGGLEALAKERDKFLRQI